MADPASPDYRHFLTAAESGARFGPTDDTIARLTADVRAAGLDVVSMPAAAHAARGGRRCAPPWAPSWGSPSTPTRTRGPASCTTRRPPIRSCPRRLQDVVVGVTGLSRYLPVKAIDPADAPAATVARPEAGRPGRRLRLPVALGPGHRRHRHLHRHPPVRRRHGRGPRGLRLHVRPDRPPAGAHPRQRRPRRRTRRLRHGGDPRHPGRAGRRPGRPDPGLRLPGCDHVRRRDGRHRRGRPRPDGVGLLRQVLRRRLPRASTSTTKRPRPWPPLPPRVSACSQRRVTGVRSPVTRSTRPTTRSRPSIPACTDNVVSVGGTFLDVGPDGSYLRETGWEDYLTTSGTGGGFSLVDPMPDYQVGVPGSRRPLTARAAFGDVDEEWRGRRACPDIAASADSDTGYLLFFTDPETGPPTGRWSAARAPRHR